MNLFKNGIILLTILVTTQLASAQERDRSKIQDKDKWNLADLYPTEEAWLKKKKEVEGQIDQEEQRPEIHARRIGNHEGEPCRLPGDQTGGMENGNPERRHDNAEQLTLQIVKDTVRRARALVSDRCRG